MRQKPVFLFKKNLITLARSSIGSRIFRQLYFRVGKKDIDVLENGNLSCAFFVSYVLKLLGLIPEIHTTVKETVKDMRRAGWRPIRPIQLAFTVRSRAHGRGRVALRKSNGRQAPSLRPTSAGKQGRPIRKPKAGAVIVYAPKKFRSGNIHKHVGICIGSGTVISNSSKKRSPRTHKWDYRPVEEILWHKKLGR